ncbi:MAG: DUF2157 domain-containing protein [Flavobacteriaceae bacterium]|jgi:uncharacterized membrane protein|nr:DUF2157 domain-containing protein [Flavobacteriaceae bacterium]
MIEKINKDDIHTIGRHSNWSKKSVDEVLQKEIYNDADSWRKFIQIALIALGTGFTIIGVVFFFAYNWDDIHKFIKIGIVEGVILIMGSMVLFTKMNITIKNILLTGTAVLVGVLFAVFGQIYQTGANAYDLFLTWVFAITLWVLISNFAPLWLLYITLINTTFILYSQQVATDWSVTLIALILSVINTVFLVTFLFISKIRENTDAPVWFSNIIALAAVIFATGGIMIGIIIDEPDYLISSFILMGLTGIFYCIGIWYAYKEKRAFYLAVIPFSTVIIISTGICKTADGDLAGTLLLLTFFVIASVTLIVINILNTQKKWKNEHN